MRKIMLDVAARLRAGTLGKLAAAQMLEAAAEDAVTSALVALEFGHVSRERGRNFQETRERYLRGKSP